ncbi:hypothetical protein EVAR_28777_1 [Eumeta japonica]|uniref:Uncharacterized protein n=1 Tax=Eumeta variegata TaxID=151549 RepID=A0A4C1VIH7_EUMVA|nr:hypothetical protein EVAR_28777_1 [Eumeta japonica]
MGVGGFLTTVAITRCNLRDKQLTVRSEARRDWFNLIQIKHSFVEHARIVPFFLMLSSKYLCCHQGLTLHRRTASFFPGRPGARPKPSSGTTTFRSLQPMTVHNYRGARPTSTALYYIYNHALAHCVIARRFALLYVMYDVTPARMARSAGYGQFFRVRE